MFGHRLLLGLAALASASPALAQNAEPFFYSDDAALTSGAVAAYPAEPGAVFYNPAGLGALHRSRVSLSGSVVGIRVRSVEGALVTRIGEAESALELSSVDFLSSPTAISAAFALHPAVTLGLGLYTTARDLRSTVDDDLEVDAGGGSSLTQRIDLQYDATKYQAGLAVGFALSDTVRLGVGVFAIYASSDTLAQYSIELALADQAAFESAIVRTSATAWGLLPTVGFQWDPSPAVHLALFARAPEIMLAASTESAITATAASTFGTEPIALLEVVHSETESDSVELLAPPRFGVAAAFDPAPSVRLSLEADVATPMNNEELSIEREVVVNGRIGLRAQVTKELVLGGGFFTDLASSPLSETFGATRVHHLGTTFGGSLLTPLSVGDNKDPDALVLATTLAARYALGFGQARTLSYDGQNVGYGEEDVIFHDLMPYTSSAILF